MSHSGPIVTTVIFVTSGLLSIGSSVENKICFNVSNQRICYFQPQKYLTDTWKTWEMARSICQKSNATLPIIENQDIQKTFEQYLSNISLNTNRIWLGGRQEATEKEWQWSNNKPFYQPDLISGGDHNSRTQAVIWRTSKFPSKATIAYLAVYTSRLDYYICQYSGSQCAADSPVIKNEYHGCLKVFYYPRLNASEATKKCNNGGGHLAIFDGDEFLTEVPEVIQQMEYHSQLIKGYYVGLHRNDTKSWFWKRSNNENSTMEGNYSNWSDRNNNSNGDCLFATAHDQRWEASRCDDWKCFICQTIEILETTTTTREGTESQLTNMNDQHLSVPLIGAIAGTAALVIIAFIIIIVLLRRHCRKRKAVVAKSPKLSASYVKPKVAEKSEDYNSPAVYKEIQLKTTEEEDKEATVYAEITAPPSDRNQNHSQQGGDTGIVYAAVEFTNNYN